MLWICQLFSWVFADSIFVLLRFGLGVMLRFVWLVLLHLFVTFLGVMLRNVT